MLTRSLNLAVQSRIQLGSDVKHWYGIERNITSTSPDWSRIASSVAAMDLHRTLPAQNTLVGVVLNSNKTVNYYLDPMDWSKKRDGTPSILTGADGNVMVRKDKAIYWKFETEGNIQRVKCSLFPLEGFTKSSEWNIGAYEGSVVSTKLSSFKNILPQTNRTKAQFRTFARNNGSGYEMLYYNIYKELVWLYVLEYASNNVQKAVDLTLTTEGYKRGGLGLGLSNVNTGEWWPYNNGYPFNLCGVTDSLGNGSGEVPVTIANFAGAGISRSFVIPRYRGIENLFSSYFKLLEGLITYGLADRREVWTFDNPADFSDSSTVNGRLIGILPATSGNVGTIAFGERGDITPTTIAGSTGVSYFTDAHYPPALSSGFRLLIHAGGADTQQNSGLFFLRTDVVTFQTSYGGSRLCAV